MSREDFSGSAVLQSFAAALTSPGCNLAHLTLRDSERAAMACDDDGADVSDLPCNIRRGGRAIPCNWRVIPCNIRRKGV